MGFAPFISCSLYTEAITLKSGIHSPHPLCPLRAWTWGWVTKEPGGPQVMGQGFPDAELLAFPYKLKRHKLPGCCLLFPVWPGRSSRRKREAKVPGETGPDMVSVTCQSRKVCGWSKNSKASEGPTCDRNRSGKEQRKSPPGYLVGQCVGSCLPLKGVYAQQV